MHPTPNPTILPVLGRPLRAVIRSRALRVWLREHWHHPEHVVPAHPIAIECIQEDEAPPPLDGAPGEVWLGARAMPCVLTCTAFEYREERCGVRLTMGARGPAIRVWGLAGEDGTPSARLWATLQLAMHEALGSTGLIPFRAAVVTHDGLATALTGPGGIGDSRILLRAARDERWAVLAQDLSWLDPDTLTLYGWDRGLHVSDTMCEVAPNLALAPWQTDADGRRFLPWDALGPRRQQAAQLETVLVPTPDADATNRPIPPSEALKALWRATGLPLLPINRERVARTLVALLSRIRFDHHVLDGTVASAA